MPESRAYTGSCHCGQVSYDVTTDLAQVMQCNCSICSKRGALWTFVPANQFSLQQGSAALADYQFGKKRIHHLFCPNCGVGASSRGAGADGREMIAVNVRCLEGGELASLKPLPFDGKDL